MSGLGIALIGAQNVLYVDAATFWPRRCSSSPIRVREVRTGKAIDAVVTP